MTATTYDVPDPDDPDDSDPEPALGAVVEEGRGSLPFALVHGEALVACAAWGLGESGVTPVDIGTQWAGLIDSGEPFVLHDALCPLTPPDFIARCLATAVAHDAVVVGVRPVTDTVKSVHEGLVGETVDRTTLLSIASPIVLPASVVAQLDGLPDPDFTTLVVFLRERFDVETLEAPPTARRVAGPDDILLLEALTGPPGR